MLVFFFNFPCACFVIIIMGFGSLYEIQIPLYIVSRAGVFE